MSAIRRLRAIYPIAGIFLLLQPCFLWAQAAVETPLVGPNSVAPVLIEKWSLTNVFNMPESATYDSERQQIFVSNVNHYAKDGNGFISRVSVDGTDLELKWLTGLDSPTGLLAEGGLLYIVDYDALVIADIDRREILKRIPAPDAKPGLNDVSRSSSGQVYVSGSASSSIYILREDKLTVWKHDEERLMQANGLLLHDQQLIHGGLHWSIFDLQSKALVSDFQSHDDVIKDIDGITTHPCGGFIVSLLDDTKLWWVRTDGSSQPLTPQDINGIDLQRVGKQLFVPVVGGSLRVFEFSETSCQ